MIHSDRPSRNLQVRFIPRAKRKSATRDPLTEKITIKTYGITEEKPRAAAVAALFSMPNVLLSSV